MNRVELIARVAHEANRAYCATLGDHSPMPWEQAEQWQRESVTDGVQCALRGATPEESHENWLRFKRRDGWTYGPVKDPSRKQHPCMVPYADLPEEQRRKDVLFTSIVSAMASAIPEQ